MTPLPGNAATIHFSVCLYTPLGQNMQTLCSVVLLLSAACVAVFDLRELFMAWYSNSLPVPSVSTFGFAIAESILCVALVLLVSARLFLGS